MNNAADTITPPSGTKTNKLIFHISTGLLTLMYLGGSTRYFVEYQAMSDIFVGLGFPRWLHPVLGVTKIFAVVGLLAINLNWTVVPRWLKEWTFAGIFFNASLALLAHQMVQEPLVLSVPAVMVTTLVLISRVFYAKVCNDEGASR